MPPPWMSKVSPRYFHAHRRAFDVPAGPAASPRGCPSRARPASDGFHSTKSVGSRLVGRDLDARAGDHFVERAPRQLAVIRHRRHVEQHMALGDIGVAASRPAARSARSSRRYARSRAARSSAAGSRAPATSSWKCALVSVRQLADRNAALGGARVDLVVDVGDVADIGDVLRRHRDGAAGGTARRTRSPAAHCRYGRSRRPSARRHTCARSPDRAARTRRFCRVSVL